MERWAERDEDWFDDEEDGCACGCEEAAEEPEGADDEAEAEPEAGGAVQDAAGESAAERRARRTRRKRPVRAKTFAIRRISKEELRLGALLYPERNYWRPRVRGECRNAERPCPFVGCKFHLYLDVTQTGSIKFNFPDLEVWEMRETCALDIADRTGGVTLEEAGEIMNLTRERIRQLEAVGIRKLVDAGLVDLVDACMRRRESVEGDRASSPEVKSLPTRRAAPVREIEEAPASLARRRAAG